MKLTPSGNPHRSSEPKLTELSVAPITGKFHFSMDHFCALPKEIYYTSTSASNPDFNKYSKTSRDD
jgi:hypothetical protein